MLYLHVGILGFGTVGKGVYDLINRRQDIWKSELEAKIKVTAIAERDPDKHGEISQLIRSVDEIVKAHDIDIIIEAIGGDYALPFLLEAMNNKKHIITSNKNIISKNFDILHEKAKENNVMLLYEASVCSGIPIIDMLSEQMRLQKIVSVSGIVNGTCNFVLSEMEKGMSYEDAVAKAQSLGFAERDPSFDVDGIDSAFKLSIIASMIEGRRIGIENIKVKGISQIKKEDIDAASRKDSRIKLMASYVPHSGILKVEPAIIDSSSPFYNVGSENNAVSIIGENTGELFIRGKGAGRYPTANAVIQDLIKVVSEVKK